MIGSASPSHLGDMPPEEFRSHALEVLDWIEGYFADGRELPVFPNIEPGSVRERLPPCPPRDPQPFSAVWSDFLEHVVPGVTHWNQPGFHAYFANAASGPGILGEMLAAALNVNAMVWRSAPAATELEELVCDWLRQGMGLPGGFWGVINDTASSSTLYALAAARERALPEARARGLTGLPPGRVFVGEAHSSVDKAVMTLGLGLAGLHPVGVDQHFRMDPDALELAITEAIDAGDRPVAVVATLGTTSTVSVDPIAEIADVAGRHHVWLHVDAAYAGPAALCEELRHHFAGWERADSIVVNPHKWLFTPMDCSVLYCKDPGSLARAFSLTPEYLMTREQDSARQLMDYGISLGRRFRALKLWFVMHYFGLSGLADRIREHIRLARLFAEWIEEADDWHLAVPVHFGTAIYRYAPKELSLTEADEVNRVIMDHVNASGDAFLSHTVQDGRMFLRMSVGNIRTDEIQVRRVWELLREGAGRAVGG